ncbi:MAG TPA: dihydrofolate reductase family protein [Candidatus Paceibacterota bacterium]|nr:dihydrofolate reductase family protein [Candidatus Paceibacterota bacterium]
MIKCFIIAAQSADGFIALDPAHPSSSLNWTSKEDKKHFVELTKRAGVVVVGHTTFKTFQKPLKDRLNIVYSREPLQIEGVEVMNDEPRLLLEKLEKQGKTEVAICGGSQIYTMFMKASVVDKIYLTVEPVVFGQGLSLFKEPIEAKLRLENLEKTESGTLFLEYSVVKSET